MQPTASADTFRGCEISLKTYLSFQMIGFSPCGIIQEKQYSVCSTFIKILFPKNQGILKCPSGRSWQVLGDKIQKNQRNIRPALQIKLLQLKINYCDGSRLKTRFLYQYIRREYLDLSRYSFVDWTKLIVISYTFLLFWTVCGAQSFNAK